MNRTAIDQTEFVDFYLPFGGHLKASNRWCQLAEMVPWDEVESCYADKLSGTGIGSARQERTDRLRIPIDKGTAGDHR